ncbi:MAG: aldehyde dehydrogenase family protein [Alphaproteobacteria bacterium]|nr:aldehyde dehydrogenase family protein [Alphaproteobacteria bacterium]
MNALTILSDGKWLPASSGETLEMIDPSDGREFARIARGTAVDIARAVNSARRAFEGHWSKVPGVERGRFLAKIAESIRVHAEELASLEARDTGKPLKQARVDVTVAARYFEFYAGAADKIHGEALPFLPEYQVIAIREPYGVTGHIIPWNYPLQMGARTMAATLAAGNTLVLKPAEEACLSIVRLAEIALAAGLPPDVLNLVTGLGEEAGAALAAHPDIDHVSFTGSPEVGTLVQQAAAKRNAGCTMELGGKSPQIVFADADVDAAVPIIVNAITQNAGQTCSAGSRLLIERRAYDSVVGAVVELFTKLRVGPALADLDCGPLISATQKKRVEGFLAKAAEDGIPALARAAFANDLPAGGFYVAPTLYGPVPQSNRLASEEVFGPVLSAIPFTDEAEAIRIGNATAYGLTAGVWTENGGRQLRVAKGLKCGQVFINNYGAGGGVELPFGGMKRSGYGREKGMEALQHLTTLKTIVVKHG